MPQQRQPRKHNPRGDTRYPGITRHARELGVHRSSLYRALRGDWVLPELVARYHELLAAEAKT